MRAVLFLFNKGSREKAMSRLYSSMILGGAGLSVLLAARERARQRRKMKFNGTVALITGGSRGLGLELARQLADAGARLALCARSLDELERAGDELRARGADVFTAPCDVTDRREVEEIVHTVQDRLGPIDILINNAGTIQVGPLIEMEIEDFEQAMKVHFWAPLYMTHAVLTGMRRRGKGRIVNVSSIGGKVGVPHLAPYVASKFALTGLSEALRSELTAQGIYVTTACPGLMRTGSHVHARFKGQNQKEYAWFSIGNALPPLSIGVREAAEQILRACKFGDPEIVFPLSAKAAAFFHGVFPGVSSDIAGFVNRLLPGPGGIGRGHAAGMDSQTALSPSLVTRLIDDAAVRNNEAPAT